MAAGDVGHNLDLTITIFSEDGSTVLENADGLPVIAGSDGPGESVAVRFDAIANATYYAKITGTNSDSYDAGAWYNLRIAKLAPTATYLFNGSFAPEEPGVPDIIPVDPLGQNQFTGATVFGEARTIYRMEGNAPPDEQAGLQLDTLALRSTPDAYSVEMIFGFIEDTPSHCGRILSFDNRYSFSGFFACHDRLNLSSAEGNGYSFDAVENWPGTELRHGCFAHFKVVRPGNTLGNALEQQLQVGTFVT